MMLPLRIEVLLRKLSIKPEKPLLRKMPLNINLKLTLRKNYGQKVVKISQRICVLKCKLEPKNVLLKKRKKLMSLKLKRKLLQRLLLLLRLLPFKLRKTDLIFLSKFRQYLRDND